LFLRLRPVQGVEQPGADPVHAAQENVERVCLEEGRYLLHPARDIVDLQADHDRQASRFGRERSSDVLVEIGSEFLVPAGGRLGSPGGARIVVPPASQQRVELAETGGMPSDRQLGDPEPGGMSAVCAELIDARQQRQVRRMTP